MRKGRRRGKHEKRNTTKKKIRREKVRRKMEKGRARLLLRRSTIRGGRQVKYKSRLLLVYPCAYICTHKPTTRHKKAANGFNLHNMHELKKGGGVGQEPRRCG